MSELKIDFRAVHNTVCMFSDDCFIANTIAPNVSFLRVFAR